MCLALPGKVVSLKGRSCLIDIMGAEREVSIELLEDIKVGDYVLVHAGCAIQKIDEEEASKSLELFRELKELADE